VLERGLTFAGLVASIDPERVGVKESIGLFHSSMFLQF
jgi:magnesium-transporting ATPase (P-type)